jgi:nicotinate-nucleotide pyrophosphorylase (carboxylating)
VAIPRPALQRVVALAIEEDLGRGDVTTDACVAGGRAGHAVMRARERLVWCGAEPAVEVFRQIDPAIETRLLVPEGTWVAPGTAVLDVHGPAAGLLGGERVALNFAQRMSGVATLTRRFVEALPEGSRARITDTRKTTPGLRALERHAVRTGGGHNHREDLAAAVLIKDNHLAAAGGVQVAIERARAHAAHTSRIECEVGSLSELREALAAGADVVLCDNFDDAAVAEAVRIVAGRARVEVSGGITIERVPALARAGAEIISVGALTHSAPAVDLGLDWVEGA